MPQCTSNQEILLNYPGLTSLDLWAVQLYYSHNREEIDDLISLAQPSPSLQNLTTDHRQPSDWSSFMGCFEAEPDLSVNYKQYFLEDLEKKYGYR